MTRSADTGTAGAEEIVGTVTDADFTELVLWSEKPVLVEFWAPWCGPCRMVRPVLEAIAAEKADTLRVVTLNADENPETTRARKVISLPTLLLFADGQLVKSIHGARPKAYLLRELAEHLPQ